MFWGSALGITRYGVLAGSEEALVGPDGGRPRALITKQGVLQATHRFFLELRGIDVAYIINVDRPSYRVQTQDNKLLNWTFSTPVSITWDPINFTIREIFDGYSLTTVLGYFYNKLTDLSWDPPNEVNTAFFKDLAKLQLTEALGPVKIKSLNANGEIVETWELHGAYITSMKPSQLSYDQDSLTNISVAVKYDFATLAVADAAAASGDPFAAWKSD
jgi:hypothetical protein